MRTTIALDDALLAEAKAIAARTGRTLTGVIEDVLRAYLAIQAEVSETEERTHLPTVQGRGLSSGVDLDSPSELIDIMDRQDSR